MRVSGGDVGLGNAEEAHSELRRWLDALAEFSRAANSGLAMEELLTILAATTCHLTGYERCAILLADTTHHHLRIEGSHGLSREYVDRLNEVYPIFLDGSEAGLAPSSRAYRTQRPSIVADLDQDPTLTRWEPVYHEDVRAMASVPLMVSGTTLGVLNAYVSQPHDFGTGEIVLLETIANQVALAIEASRLRVHERARIHELEELNARLEVQHSMLERAQHVHEQLMNALLEERSREALADVVASTLHCSVVLDSAPRFPQKLIEVGPDTSALVEQYIDSGDASDRVVTGEQSGRLIDVAGEDGTADVLVVPIVVDGELAGRLWAHRSESFDEFERRTLERAAIVLAVALQAERTTSEVEWRLSRDFLDEVLAFEETTDRAALGARGLHLGIDLQRPHVVVIVRVESATREGRSGAAGTHQTGRHLLATVQRVVDEVGMSGLTAARGDHVILLWPADDRFLLDAALDRLSADVPVYGPEGNVLIGMSASCSAFEDYEPAYRSVLTAISLSTAAGSGHRVVRVPDLGVYNLLMNVRRPETLAGFSASTLAPLRRYDAEAHADLTETLRVYIEQRCHTAHTAEALFVHPNTVTYRLKRIRELTGRDPSDLDALLTYELAFMIDRLFGESAGAV